MSCNPHNVIRADDVANIVNRTVKSVIHPDSSINQNCYLGMGRFDRVKVEEYMYEMEAKKWFIAEVGLFIEYLNKIEGISYGEMSRKVDISINSISTLKLGQKASAKLLVKFRAYLSAYDRYYKEQK